MKIFELSQYLSRHLYPALIDSVYNKLLLKDVSIPGRREEWGREGMDMSRYLEWEGGRKHCFQLCEGDRNFVYKCGQDY